MMSNDELFCVVGGGSYLSPALWHITMKSGQG